jgi:hypothetical protein
MTMPTDRAAQQKLPGELTAHVLADESHFQSLSLAERGRMLDAVCAATRDILVARRKMGIPDPDPEPWPDSTIEFMRKHAPNGRTRAAE